MVKTVLVKYAGYFWSFAKFESDPKIIKNVYEYFVAAFLDQYLNRVKI